jgi:hypothetical protein
MNIQNVRCNDKKNNILMFVARYLMFRFIERSSGITLQKFKKHNPVSKLCFSIFCEAMPDDDLLKRNM